MHAEVWELLPYIQPCTTKLTRAQCFSLLGCRYQKSSYKCSFSIRGYILVYEACDKGVLHRIQGIDLGLQDVGFWDWKEGKNSYSCLWSVLRSLAPLPATLPQPHPQPTSCSFLSLLNFILYYRRLLFTLKMSTFYPYNPPLEHPS